MLEKKIKAARQTSTHGHAMILEEEARRLAKEEAIPVQNLYKVSLSLDTWPQRYVRNAGSFSCEDQIKLMEKRVCVAGCGGLGGYIAAMLARVGVGEIRLFDPDIFEASNLNRQCFATDETLGQNKAEAAQEAIRIINPSIRAAACPMDITGDEALPQLEGAHLLADGLDTLSARCTLFKRAKDLGIPMVHAAISGFEARIMVMHPQGPSFEELFGRRDDATAEGVLGTPSVTPAVAAGLQCAQIIKTLLKGEKDRESVMIHVDLMEMTSDAFRF